MKKTTLKLCLVAAISFLTVNQASAQFVSPVAPDAQFATGFNVLRYNPQTYASGIYNSILGNSNETGLYINANTGWNDGASIIMNGSERNSGSGDPNDGTITFMAHAGSHNLGGEFGFWRINPSAPPANQWESRLLIKHDGKVIIGYCPLGSPGPYKLFVEDGILTEKVKVAIKTSSQWSDYVFAKDYKLKSLNDVEAFISKNKHLPDVPSATEVVKDGIDVATMDAKLLQKIEELTLYVIQQQKEINTLKAKMNK